MPPPLPGSLVFHLHIAFGARLIKLRQNVQTILAYEKETIKAARSQYVLASRSVKATLILIHTLLLFIQAKVM